MLRKSLNVTGRQAGAPECTGIIGSRSFAGFPILLLVEVPGLTVQPDVEPAEQTVPLEPEPRLDAVSRFTPKLFVGFVSPIRVKSGTVYRPPLGKVNLRLEVRPWPSMRAR